MSTEKTSPATSRASHCYLDNRSKCFWAGHREGFVGRGARQHSLDAFEQREYFCGYSRGQIMRTKMEMIANEMGLEDDLKLPVVAAMAIEEFIQSTDNASVQAAERDL